MGQGFEKNDNFDSESLGDVMQPILQKKSEKHYKKTGQDIDTGFGSDIGFLLSTCSSTRTLLCDRLTD